MYFRAEMSLGAYRLASLNASMLSSYLPIAAIALPLSVWKSGTLGSIVTALSKSERASSNRLSSRYAFPRLLRMNGWLESILIACSNTSAAWAALPAFSRSDPFLFSRKTSFLSRAIAFS